MTYQKYLLFGSLALRLVVAVASPLVTAIPASATALRESPLTFAQHREGLTGGGVFDPNVQLPFSRPNQGGGDFDLQR